MRGRKCIQVINKNTITVAITIQVRCIQVRVQVNKDNAYR